jgi:hypothetical protein
MALAIRSIPVLKGKAAKKFVEEAKKNLRSHKHSIDFSKQASIAQKILEKSKI